MQRTHFLSIVVIIFQFVTVCQAATVKWDAIIARDYGTETSPVFSDGTYLQRNYYLSSGPAPMMFRASMLFHPNGVSYDGEGSLAPDWTQGLAVDFTAAWVEAEVGDVVNREYIENASSYFFRTIIYGYDGFDVGGAVLDTGETLYLAWAGATQSNPYDATFGWMALTLDDVGKLHISSSAWDIDGDPITVGMGAIPEPSSFLLLLVGGAMLALRRRRSE